MSVITPVMMTLDTHLPVMQANLRTIETEMSFHPTPTDVMTH